MRREANLAQSTMVAKQKENKEKCTCGPCEKPIFTIGTGNQRQPCLRNSGLRKERSIK